MEKIVSKLTISKWIKMTARLGVVLGLSALAAAPVQGGEAARGRIVALEARKASGPMPIEPPPIGPTGFAESQVPSLPAGNAAPALPEQASGFVDSALGTPAAALPPAADTEKREVVITSDPPGARVWIDGRERGETPMKVRLAAGAAPTRVVLIRAGYRAAKVALDPRSTPRLEQTLERAAPAGGPTGVRVECRSDGRYPIVINDQDTGLLCSSTPSARIALPAGTHTVGVYLPETDQVVLKQVMLAETVRSLKFRK